jgi:hypothetical protein
MIGENTMRDYNYLFATYDWHSVQENQKRQLEKDVKELVDNRILNTPVEDLCDYLEEKHKVNVPALKKDQIVADQNEVQIDVSRDPMRAVFDRSNPFYIGGTKISISIPFEGDDDVFKIRPTTFTLNPPVADVDRGNLIVSIQGIDLKADKVKREVDRTVSEIERNLATLTNDAQELNSQLRTIARQAIERRKEKLLADRNLVASLGFKIREREGVTKTFIAPEVKRKIAPVLPPVGSTPFSPEPALSDADYEHILKVIDNMALVMERSPSAFRTMDEESLRSHFLVQLNGHYEGQATGETFNYEGKTDILIRLDGRNIFIGECKYWGGPKKLLDTIDQLLGYSSWRDTKVAVIIFNQNRDFTKVLQTIDETAKKHASFKRFVGKSSETSFRYTFAHRDDPNREMLMTVMAFDIPK